MNKYLLTQLLLLVVLTCESQTDSYFKNKYHQQNVNPTEFLSGMTSYRLTNLKGNIAEIKHITYRPDPTNESEFIFFSGTSGYGLVFNEKGQIIEERGYSDVEAITFTTKYHDFFNGIVEGQYSYDKEGNLTRYEKPKLNDAGILIGKEFFTGDTTVYDDWLIYDLNDTTKTRNKWFEFVYVKGKQIELISYNGHNNWVYDYHPNGMKKSGHNYENQLLQTEEKYNEHGLIIEDNRFSYDSTNTVNEKKSHIHYYDGTLKIKTDKIRTTNNFESISTFEFEYDDNQKLLYTYKTSNHVKEKVGHVEYNSNGDIIIQKFDNETTEYKNYKYDEKGNWTEREQWINGSLFFKFIREIKYE